MSNRKQHFRLLPQQCWHWLKWGGTFHSSTDGTFQSDAGGTNHSDIPGTFKSDMDGTFKLLQSKYPAIGLKGEQKQWVDRLSLALSLKTDNDPRIEKEVERMIKEMQWKD